MTIEQLEDAVNALGTTVTAQAALIESLRVEVKRGADMIQELSESHDQNRRELQFATKRAQDLNTQLTNGIDNVRELHSRVLGMKG